MIFILIEVYFELESLARLFWDLLLRLQNVLVSSNYMRILLYENMYL